MRELIHRENGKIRIPLNLTFPMQGKDYDVPAEMKGVFFHKNKPSRRHDCYGAIYMLFNEKNGKAYIGQTVQPINRRVIYTILSALKKRNGLYNTMISRAIRKYGIENFSVWELSRHYSKEELNKAEVDAIKKYSTNKFAGYNSESGGKKGFSMHSRSRRMMSISQTGEGNGRYGKPVSEETRRKIGYANGGDRSAWKGKKHTAEERRKIGESNREYYIKHPECAASISARRRKRVICLETTQVFESLNDAAAWLKVSNGSISSVCSGHVAAIKGFHFEYYKEGKR